MLDMILKWDGFIFPRLARTIYFVGVAVIAMGTLGAASVTLATGSASGEAGNAVVAVVIMLFGGAVGLVLWRLYMELMTVLFSIHDLLRDLRDQGRKTTP